LIVTERVLAMLARGDVCAMTCVFGHDDVAFKGCQHDS
jgi:hypothetical protein